VSLQGATLRQDDDANHELYGKKIDNRQIAESSMTPPAAAAKLLALLDQYASGQAKERHEK
jgi:lipid-binding SYLF domain-containing protein